MKIFQTFFVIILCMLVTSCIWGSSDASDQSSSSWSTEKKAWLTAHTGIGFWMYIPASWDILDSSSEALPRPKKWKIELAVTSTDKISNFTNTLIVLSDNLNANTSSLDYSIANNVGSRNDYHNYTKLEWSEFNFADWEESMLYVFEAQYTQKTPTLKFIQTAYVCNNTQAYFITLALPTSIRSLSKYKKMISSFTCQ